MITELSKVNSSFANLPIKVLLLGLNHSQEPIYRYKGVPFYNIIYCEKGRGELIINNSKVIILEKQLFVLKPDSPHEYRAITEDWIVHFIGFKGSICNQLVHELGIIPTNTYEVTKDILFSQIVESMLTIFNTSSNFEIELSTLCYSLLISLTDSLKPSFNKPYLSKNKIVIRIIKFIEENYHEPIGLLEIAEECNLSKEHICRVFKSEMGQTINYFLNIIRITRARSELLQYPEKKVFEIAIACGFQDPSYFGMIFKKITGTSPEVYRKL